MWLYLLYKVICEMNVSHLNTRQRWKVEDFARVLCVNMLDRSIRKTPGPREGDKPPESLINTML